MKAILDMPIFHRLSVEMPCREWRTGELSHHIEEPVMLSEKACVLR